MVNGLITYSGGHAARGSKDGGAERVAPVDTCGSGIVVWSAILVRTVMNAVLEVGLGASALEVSGAAAQLGSLGNHVVGACFLERGDVRSMPD